MSYTTIQQISDALALHSVRIDAAQSDADFAQTEAARALSSIYDTGLQATLYTNTEIQRLKDELRLEYQQADDAKRDELLAALNGEISSALPGLLNDYYGPYAGMQGLYDLLVARFGQSDAAIDNLLNVVFPGLQNQVDSIGVTAGNVQQNFDALQASLQSVLVVYAIDAAGNDQSLTAGSREYVQYVEYNGNPPTLPVSGTFTKFVGTAQSVWPIYASTAAGNDQSFEPGTRQYVTFYESPVAPDLPVSGQTFVKYVGNDGASGERGAGVWYVSVVTLPSTTSTAAQNAWNAAVAAGQDIPTRPKIQDQVYFYTGLQGNPTGQRVFICNWVVSNTSHGWDYQENVMRGDLLVPGTVTSNEIDSRGLTIRDELGNVVLQATGGSAGIDWSKIFGANRPADNANYITSTSQIVDGAGLGQTANWGNITGYGKPDNFADQTSNNVAAGIANQGNFATLDQITASNVGTYIASAAIGSAYIGNLSAAKITTGSLSAARLNLNGLVMENVGGQLSVRNGGINTGRLENEAVTNYHVRGSYKQLNSSTNWNRNLEWVEIACGTSEALEIGIFFYIDGVSSGSLTEAQQKQWRWRIQEGPTGTGTSGRETLMQHENSDLSWSADNVAGEVYFSETIFLRNPASTSTRRYQFDFFGVSTFPAIYGINLAFTVKKVKK